MLTLSIYLAAEVIVITFFLTVKVVKVECLFCSVVPHVHTAAAQYYKTMKTDCKSDQLKSHKSD